MSENYTLCDYVGPLIKCVGYFTLLASMSEKLYSNISICLSYLNILSSFQQFDPLFI